MAKEPAACVAELGRLVGAERRQVLECWRRRVLELPSARGLETPVLDDDMPQFLDELAAELCGSDEPETGRSVEEDAVRHGIHRFTWGFDIEEVVAEYGALRACLYALAERHAIPLEGRLLHVVDAALDFAVGTAVRSFAEQQAATVRRRREEYLAFVAHDVRTPLHAVAMAAQALEGHLPAAATDPAAHRMLDALRRNVGHLQDLVAKVLEESASLLEGAALERRRIDFWPFVETLLRDLEPAAKSAGVRLQNAVPDPFRVDADAHLLRRILDNLVGNAIEHAPGGTAVVGARRLDAGVEVWVADDGPGMSQEVLREALHRTSRAPRGTRRGLGLAIVRHFVEMHDGHVTAESVPGHGTTFRIVLPHGT